MSAIMPRCCQMDLFPPCLFRFPSLFPPLLLSLYIMFASTSRSVIFIVKAQDGGTITAATKTRAIVGKLKKKQYLMVFDRILHYFICLVFLLREQQNWQCWYCTFASNVTQPLTNTTAS